MQPGATRRIRLRPTGHAVCDCCGLRTARADLLPWTRRIQGRELTLQDPARRQDRRPEEEWVTGVYRHYFVTLDFEVCNPCFDYLLDGGEFASALRHRTKIGFLALLFVVVVLIVLLPDLLPVLRSALWLDKGE
jgi:hypothetical protein